MYITLNVVPKKVLCVNLRHCRARIAVERKFSLYETRYDWQVDWESGIKKLTWNKFEVNIKLLTINSIMVPIKTLDGSADVVCNSYKCQTKLKKSNCQQFYIHNLCL